MGVQTNIKTVKICITYATTSLTTTWTLKGCFLQQAMENSHAMELEVHWNDLFLMLAFSVLIILKFSTHMACLSTEKKKKKIQGIKFIFITKDELTKTWESLEDRFDPFQYLKVLFPGVKLSLVNKLQG